jgi:uncharacterized protein (DUF433 family)
MLFGMHYRDRLTSDPDVRDGKPIVRGTQTTVGDILFSLADGMTEEDVLDTYPWLTAEDIQACLAFMMDPERSVS